MTSTLYQVKIHNGRIFRIFCKGKNQHKRFFDFTQKIENMVESIEVISNGIHTITEFEKITTNLLK